MDIGTLAADGAFTVRDSARFIGISERQIYRLIARGDLAILREGARVLVPRRSAQDFLRKGLEKERSRVEAHSDGRSSCK